jgi:hypothetical protein
VLKGESMSSKNEEREVGFLPCSYLPLHR